MKNEIWTTATGHKISTGKMTEEHLRNALNKILRHKREKLELRHAIGCAKNWGLPR